MASRNLIDANVQLGIRAFINWMYEKGPDPNAVTREKLWQAWREYQRTQPKLTPVGVDVDDEPTEDEPA